MRWIYTLLLSDNYFYVGFTENLSQRMEQHFSGEGAKWTQLHKPIKIIEVVIETHDWQEDFTTLVMMRKHGIDRVRGGTWCSVWPLKEIPQHYSKIDPNLSLDDNLRLLSKDTNKRNELVKDDEILRLFKEGKNEFEISQLVGSNVIDIEKHLILLVKQGKISSVDIGLTPFKTMQIESTIKKLHPDNRSLISIKALCDRSINIVDIRYYMALK